MMFTLDSTTFDVLDHPDFTAPMVCRSKARVRQWGPETFRVWLAKPRQMAITDGVDQILRQVPHLLDPDLKAALLAYQEGS